MPMIAAMRSAAFGCPLPAALALLFLAVARAPAAPPRRWACSGGGSGPRAKKAARPAGGELPRAATPA
eukprot:2641115-Alexandrium_andersonii.AAC.1